MKKIRAKRNNVEFTLANENGYELTFTLAKNSTINVLYAEQYADEIDIRLYADDRALSTVSADDFEIVE